MTLFDSLAASPFTTAGFIAMGAALTLLTARIFWVAGRERERREAPRLALRYVIREIVADSAEDAEQVAENVRERDWVN